MSPENDSIKIKIGYHFYMLFFPEVFFFSDHQLNTMLQFILYSSIILDVFLLLNIVV